jgi:hypothetical protein
MGNWKPHFRFLNSYFRFVASRFRADGGVGQTRISNFGISQWPTPCLGRKGFGSTSRGLRAFGGLAGNFAGWIVDLRSTLREHCNNDPVAAAVGRREACPRVPVCVRSGRQLGFRVAKPMRTMGFRTKSCRPHGRQLFGLADKNLSGRRSDSFVPAWAGYSPLRCSVQCW